MKVKIIKKQPDFYDSVLGYGVDESIIYKRSIEENYFFENKCSLQSAFSCLARDQYEGIKKLKPSFVKIIEKIQDKGMSLPVEIDIGKGFNKLRVSMVYFVFCGEVIPSLVVSGSWLIHPKAPENKKHSYENFKEVAYTMDDFIKILNLFMGNDEAANYLEKEKRWSSMKRKDYFSQVFDGFENYSTDEFHHEIDCPVVLIYSSGYVKNPVLKEYKFAKKYDPFTTYQKLEQYISGVLGGMSPKMVQIDDIHRLEGHGFDKKISFRKRKET